MDMFCFSHSNISFLHYYFLALHYLNAYVFGLRTFVNEMVLLKLSFNKEFSQNQYPWNRQCEKPDIRIEQ